MQKTAKIGSTDDKSAETAEKKKKELCIIS